MKALLILLLLTVSVRAQETPKFTLANSGCIALTMPVAETVTFHVGNDGEIIINLHTGNVTFKNVKPNKASMAFWKSLITAYPDIKKAIRDGKR